MESRPIRRLLIANRGEIAVRVARCAAELGIETVAIASEADSNALHARCADRSIVIGGAAAAESYLRGSRIIEIAKQEECDAIHPGYGFLSQNADFADAVAEAGVIFVGPPGSAMRLMGDKTSARRAMQAAGVPVVPGFQGSGNEDNATLKREALKIGFPLLVKAAAGGGGRGMRIVREQKELDDALASAGREAEKAFGDGRLFIERFLGDAHHVEIQVLADQHGNCLHLFERECSVQRRYQKLIEESPSPLLNEDLRQRMGEAAVRAAKACGYVSAGTIEFLVTRDRQFYFLEMNTRIQVEHPVTELITGIDLVAQQLHVAGGGALSFGQGDVTSRGHAIECRINAEDPAADFAPSVGTLHSVRWPSGPGIRIDAGYASGDVLTHHYDSLVAKLIVHAATRDSAIRKMRRALTEATVLGIETNAAFLAAVLDDARFQRGEATTTFVRDALADWQPQDRKPSPAALVAAALFESAAAKASLTGAGGEVVAGADPWNVRDSYRVGG